MNAKTSGRQVFGVIVKNMSHQSSNQFMQIFKAFFYSIEGLKVALLERAFKQELVICAVLIPIAVFSNLSGASKIALIASLMLVLIVELLNSAIEALVDRISVEQHVLSKKAKDLGSAAVFLAIVNAVVAWIVVWS